VENRPGPSDVEKSVHGLVSAVLAAGGNPFPPDLRDETLAALVATHEAPPGTRPVDVVEFAAAAGGGTEIDSERVRGLAWFSRSWLDRLGLDATKCAIIRVRGESMEPALPDGCSIMFDRSRQDRREHGIYVVRTNGGLIVKRAVKSGRGWELVEWLPAGSLPRNAAALQRIAAVGLGAARLEDTPAAASGPGPARGHES